VFALKARVDECWRCGRPCRELNIKEEQYPVPGSPRAPCLEWSWHLQPSEQSIVRLFFVEALFGVCNAVDAEGRGRLQHSAR
jgi:hypothetical protein